MKGHLRTGISIAVSVLLLTWTLRDVSLAVVVREIGDADPLLFGFAVLIAVAGFGIRALRWGLLLLPMDGGAPPFRPRYAATMVGMAANNLLPARVGEFARAFTLSRLSRVPLVAAIATLVIERLFDGLVVVGLLFASMAASSFPVEGAIAGLDPRSAARVFALLMLGVGAGLGALVMAPQLSVRLLERATGRFLPASLRRSVIAALHSFVEGLAVLRNGRLFLMSGLLAVTQWLFTALSYLLGIWAFGIREVGFAGAVFMQSLVSLAVAVPSSPGFFGPFEAAAKLGLGLWNVPAEKAVSFAVGYHLAGFLPVTLIGIYYVWRMNLSWREVQKSETREREEPASPRMMLREEF